MNSLTKQHDLSLGKWGPYNKDYYGICHIASEELGASFAVELFPALFMRKIPQSHQMCEGDVRVWGANAERTAFAYRYELEWKDKVYCDARFNITDDRRVDIECELVNNTDMPQSINVYLTAGFLYPTKKRGATHMGYKELSEVKLPESCVFIDAPDYSDIACTQALAQDGKLLGEAEVDFATGCGTVVGGGTFYAPEHFLKYKFNGVAANSVGIRYAAKADTRVTLSANGREYELSLPATGGFGYTSLDIDGCELSELVIRPTGAPLDIDCVIAGIDAGRAEFSARKRYFKPIERRVEGNAMTLRYHDSDYTYKIEWFKEAQMIRRLYTDNVGKLLEAVLHDKIAIERTDGGSPEGVFEDIMTEPVYVNPHSKAAIRFVVTSEKAGEPAPARPKKHAMYSLSSNSDGEKYIFSQNIMAYTTLLNVVYPIYTRRGYIRHSTPGRIWNSLYTWDSGFIGMGLSTVAFEPAYENLRAYLTPVGDKHSPYIFHGSVVPTQLFLYLELVNRYPEKHARLRELYPMVKQYYDFFSNMSEQPEQMKSGILKTWHIFYNSGGWDDYPPQKELRRRALGGLHKGEKHDSHTTPVITTSLAVLIAKIMKNIAGVFGIAEDNAQYDRDIERYSQAIERQLWDDEAGYYSYLEHDGNGNPTGFMRYEDGTNYNCGLDGAYPYIAGISQGERAARLIDNIKNGMMTKYGLGVVDTRAPYYTPYGYWNGSVWMPHQWIVIKALLDRGEVDFAAKIAKTAISIWKREVDNSYLCFENFMSANGRGAGYHQFSGLSTPVLMFFDALYRSGTLTCGFATVVKSSRWNTGKTELTVNAVSNCDGAYVIACMNENCKYKFTVNGKSVKAKRLTHGAYAIPLGTLGEKNIAVKE